jgi:hypothetical protein
MPSTVEVRCPTGPRKLFTKLKLGETTARMIQPSNLIEFRCPDCTRLLRRSYGDAGQAVYHRYNFIGELVETIACAAGVSPP